MVQGTGVVKYTVARLWGSVCGVSVLEANIFAPSLYQLWASTVAGIGLLYKGVSERNGLPWVSLRAPRMVSFEASSIS